MGWTTGSLGNFVRQALLSESLSAINDLPPLVPHLPVPYESLPSLAKLQEFIERTRAAEAYDAAEKARKKEEREFEMTSEGLKPRDLTLSPVSDGREKDKGDRAIDCLKRLGIVTEQEWLLLRTRFLQMTGKLPAPERPAAAS